MEKGDEIYLSRLALNPLSREVRSDVSDCHKLHERILSAFPKAEGSDQKARERFGVLHRLDHERRKYQLVLLVQSKLKPDWSVLPPGYLLEGSNEENPACKLVHEKYAALQAGQELLFRLRANPTRRVRECSTREHDPKFYGKRVDVRGEDAQVEWLRRKGQACGFELGRVSVNKDAFNLCAAPEGRVTGRYKDRAAESVSKSSRLTFGSVLFEGELIVSEVESFRQAIVEGIGSAKAFGFGLLSIAPGGRLHQ